jgi:hypothetical protein
MSAVDQAYRYAINLPCDWIIVTSMRETRLYHKGSPQNAYECFETTRLASEPALLKRFVFLLGAERVVPMHRDCHLYELLRASESVGRELTNQFYALYADIRQRVLSRLCRENATVAPQEILRCIQKLLDRVLFCAFCEDRGLMPAESLKRAFEHRDPYNPHPLWHNFRGLFRAIDEGNAGLNIPAYNGSLFAADPALDALQVPDEVCAHVTNSLAAKSNPCYKGSLWLAHQPVFGRSGNSATPRLSACRKLSPRQSCATRTT